MTADLTVTPASVTGITFDDASFIYDGTAKSLSITGTLPVGTSVSYANNSRTDVGTQEVTATISGSNFTTLVLTADLTVTPATVTGITFDDASFVYDGTAKSLAITGTLPLGTTVSYTNNSRTDVGTQEVTATISGSNFTTLVLTADLTVTPAFLDITVNSGQSKIYGDADPVFTFTANGFEAGDNEGILAGALTREAGENVGTYAINLGTLDAGGNYSINYTGAEFEITPRTLNVLTNPNQAKVYGSPDPVLTFTATNFGNGDTEAIITGALSREFGEKKGKYAILIGTLSAGSNYTINFTSATFTIAAKVLDITAEAGQGKVFGTADPLLTYQVTGFENGDDTGVLSGKLERALGENVGSYAINLGTLHAGSNYTINFVGGDFVISKADILGITFGNGSFVYDGTAKSLAVSGTLPTGTSVAYANNSRTNVGGQEVTATISGSNYNQLVLKADLTVTPAPITGIVFEDGSFVYDGTAKSLMITGTLPTGTSVAYTNNSRTEVGTQEVTATISGSNYTTLELKADLTVLPANIAGLKFEDGTFEYDGTAKSLRVTGTLPAGTSVAYSNNSRTEVGTQVVTATINGPNFNEISLFADLSITPATLTVVVDGGQFKEFGSLDPELTFKASGFKGIDTDAILTGTLSREPGEEVGSYDITLGSLSAGSNYTIDFIGAEFMILEEPDIDTDGDGVPNEIEKEQGTDPTDPMDYQDEDGDDVPDYVEEQQGTNPNDQEDYLDQDEDKVPDYVEEREGTDSNDGEDYQDVDGDRVPDYIEKIQGTDPTDPMDYPDQDGDEVPDYVEEQQDTDPQNAGDYVDTDGDDVPDYVEEQQGTDPNDGDDFLDEDEDGLPDYVNSRAVVEFIAQGVEVLWGTPESDLKLPMEVVAMTAIGEFINLPVVWDLDGYDPFVSGTGNYDGTSDLPEGVFNPADLSPSIQVTVLAKPAPTDVTLSANSFIALPDVFFQEIGVFTVIDPTDDQHTLTLPEGVQDNEYFEVIDGILFWSSAEQAQGKTEFTILLNVEDRGGNVLEKSFQITRQRTPLDQLDLTNTFTPNGDGVNDTWGVPALRYYQGVRISIMEVGGNRVFYTENPDIRWDGTFDGKELPVGAYFWVIEVAETGEVRRGVLNLLRQ